MAATYAELKTEIQRWLDNDNPNLVAEIPTFIADAEAWFRRHLHTREMECSIITPLVPDGVTEANRGIYDLPADWGGHQSVSIYGEDLLIHYWQKIPTLSDSVTDNWLLLKYPDLYRWASLMSAEAFLKNDPRINTWSSRAAAALGEVQAHDVHDKTSGGPIRTRRDSDTMRPWAHRSSTQGRLEYLSPFEFYDLMVGGQSSVQPEDYPGYFTVTRTHIRIWPKPG